MSFKWESRFTFDFDVLKYIVLQLLFFFGQKYNVQEIMKPTVLSVLHI